MLLYYTAFSQISYFPTELVKTASEFQAKVDMMKARGVEEIEYGRAERMHKSNGEILKATRPAGGHKCNLSHTLKFL